MSRNLADFTPTGVDVLTLGKVEAGLRDSREGRVHSAAYVRERVAAHLAQLRKSAVNS